MRDLFHRRKKIPCSFWIAQYWYRALVNLIGRSAGSSCLHQFSTLCGCGSNSTKRLTIIFWATTDHEDYDSTMLMIPPDDSHSGLGSLLAGWWWPYIAFAICLLCVSGRYCWLWLLVMLLPSLSEVKQQQQWCAGGRRLCCFRAEYRLKFYRSVRARQAVKVLLFVLVLGTNEWMSISRLFHFLLDTFARL